MKKKIKNLTYEEIYKICNKHICEICPLNLNPFDDDDYICVKFILNSYPEIKTLAEIVDKKINIKKLLK